MVRTLGISRVVVNGYSYDCEDEEDAHYAHEMSGNLPAIALHGTSSQHITDILRYGLRPDTEHGNWPIGKFKGRVFLTVSRNKAVFHANHATQDERRARGHPVVVKMKIPDRMLIDMDFDIASAYYGMDHDAVPREYAHARDTSQGYHPGTPHRIRKFSPKTDFTRETGVFSYRGRIPAQYVVSVIVPVSSAAPLSQENSVEVQVKDFVENLDMFLEWGFYDEVAFDEMRYEDEEDD